MYRRKIQLIAGTTYSISLPKEWVKKNNLKEKDEIVIYEKNNRTLSLSSKQSKGRELKEISLNVDEYSANIDQLLFAVYYLGAEKISIFSNTELTKSTKTRIRKTLTHMSGTEIEYEDKKEIRIRVLLDKSKVSITQILYRISLIIDSSIANMLDYFDIDEIKINENEIDRLYHLISKVISISLIDSNVLNSSNIKNVSLIPFYFLISKRLESIADVINHLSVYLHSEKKNFKNKRKILDFIRKETVRSIDHLVRKKSKIFENSKESDINNIRRKISEIKDKTVRSYLSDAIRYLLNIEEEVVNVSFYNKLIKENKL